MLAATEGKVVRPTINGGTMVVHAETLLSGRRGLRLLLAYTLMSAGERSELGSAVFQVSRNEESIRCGSRPLFRSSYTTEEVANFIDKTPLLPVTDGLLSRCLQTTVEGARYWQEPDGEDLVASAQSVRRSLLRVAEHVVESGSVDWWFTGIDRSSQYHVAWNDPEFEKTTLAEERRDLRAKLAQERRQWIAGEQRARAERPADPTAHWSGVWWARPSGVPSSSRLLACHTGAGDVPVHLQCIEDSLEINRALVSHLAIPEHVSVYEVDSAQAWAELCRRFPLDQSMEKRHDWFRATGRVGAWVIPDWAAVADAFDGVHLQVGTYLACAGEVIDVDDGVASSIAGWEPDVTYWFIPSIGAIGEPQQWRLVESDEDMVWEMITERDRSTRRS